MRRAPFEASILPFGDEAGDGGWRPVDLAALQEDPIHLVTSASLAELKALHPDGNPDPRRFHPNILVDMQPVAGAFPRRSGLVENLRSANWN